jgi:hypothetical protein
MIVRADRSPSAMLTLLNLYGTPVMNEMTPSSPPVAARNGRLPRTATALTAFEWPMISPHELPPSSMSARPKLSRPSPTTISRFDSPSQATSLIRPLSAPFVSSLTICSVPATSQTRSVPAASAEAQ